MKRHLIANHNKSSDITDKEVKEYCGLENNKANAQAAQSFFKNVNKGNQIGNKNHEPKNQASSINY